MYGFYSIPEKLWYGFYSIPENCCFFNSLLCMDFIPFLKNCGVYGFYFIPEKLWCVWLVFIPFLKNCGVYGFYSTPETFFNFFILFPAVCVRGPKQCWSKAALATKCTICQYNVTLQLYNSNQTCQNSAT